MYWRIIFHALFVTWDVYSNCLHQSGKPNHCALGGKGFIIGIRASTMWGRWRSKWGVGEAVSQKPVQPVTQVDGERKVVEGFGELYSVVAPLCGFTARYLW